MSRKHYRALYDFEAVDAAELSIAAGERVVSVPDEAGTVEQDDWVHVQALEDATRRGFVPTGYLEETPNPEVHKRPPARPSIRVTPSTAPVTAVTSIASGAANNNGEDADPIAALAEGNAMESTPSKATTASALSVLSQSARLPESPRSRHVFGSQTTPRLGLHRAQIASTIQSQTLLSPGKAAFTPGMGAHTPRSALSHTPKTMGRAAVPTFTGTPRMPNLSTAMNTGDYEQLIKKNSEYFERLKASRSETFTHLNEMVDSLGKRLNESAQMCNDLVAQVGELDELIEAERRRWKQQLEMEKTTGLISAAENTRAI